MEQTGKTALIGSASDKSDDKAAGMVKNHKPLLFYHGILDIRVRKMKELSNESNARVEDKTICRCGSVAGPDFFGADRSSLAGWLAEDNREDNDG